MATVAVVWAGDGGPWWLFRAIFSRRPILHPVSGPSCADRCYRLPLAWLKKKKSDWFHAQRERGVRMADGWVPHGKLNGFITDGCVPHVERER
jgi:hypothetical protein